MKIIFSTLFISIFISVSAQKDSVRVLFYNVENLFDTKDDPLKNDNEFLPHSKKNWNNFKLNDKINKIAKVIAAGNFPDVIGLCEVENDSVLFKLVQHSILYKKKYQIIHFESPDQRGIDCALLYKTKKFDVLSMKPNPVKIDGRKTRDILSTTLVHKKDTFVFFVNHWPSRYGGKKKSVPKRISAANQLKLLMDSVVINYPKRKVISMGDFNDEPRDSSLQILKNYSNRSDTFKGTIKYKGKWQVFDQFICSENLNYNSRVLNWDFLMEEDKTYGNQKPFRTYYGPRYNGGFSDHLPILLIFYAP